MFGEIPDWYGASENENKREPVKRSTEKEVLTKQKGRCAKCGINFHVAGVLWHIDHKKPVSKGGKSNLSNLQALCPNCHAKKHQKERVKDDEKKRKKKGSSSSVSGFAVPDFKAPAFKAPKFRSPW